jgi:uncharacterized RDD family membrane protein YckC
VLHGKGAPERGESRAGYLNPVPQDSRNPARPGGARLAAAPGASARDTAQDYPGKRFGLPQEGTGSAAPLGRRLLALVIDWLLCELIVSAILRHSLVRVNDSAYSASQYWTLIACFAEIYLLTAMGGTSVGKRLLRIRVMRVSGGRPGFGWAALRTVLLFCVVPPLVADRDLRGLHDRAADTVVVRV